MLILGPQPAGDHALSRQPDVREEPGHLPLHLPGDGKVQFDLADEITSGTLMCRDGEVIHGRLRQILGLAALENKAAS